jgi:hypothetical protein
MMAKSAAKVVTAVQTICKKTVKCVDRAQEAD